MVRTTSRWTWYLHPRRRVLFSIGIAAFLIKRNIITIFMSIELMLNAVNLTFVAFAHMWHQVSGQIFVFFVMVVAAAEAAVGLAIIICHLPHPQDPQRRRDRPAETMSPMPANYLWLIPLLPFAGFLINGTAGPPPSPRARQRRRPARHRHPGRPRRLALVATAVFSRALR